MFVSFYARTLTHHKLCYNAQLHHQNNLEIQGGLLQMTRPACIQWFLSISEELENTTPLACDSNLGVSGNHFHETAL